MNDLAIITVLFMLVLAVIAALILISFVVPKGFNNTYRTYKVYKPKYYKRSRGKK